MIVGSFLQACAYGFSHFRPTGAFQLDLPHGVAFNAVNTQDDIGVHLSVFIRFEDGGNFLFQFTHLCFGCDQFLYFRIVGRGKRAVPPGQAEGIAIQFPAAVRRLCVAEGQILHAECVFSCVFGTVISMQCHSVVCFGNEVVSRIFSNALLAAGNLCFADVVGGSEGRYGGAQQQDVVFFHDISFG